MNYSKIILFGLLFLCKIAISVEPQELLAQWKLIAEQQRVKEVIQAIAPLKAEYEQLKQEVTQTSKEKFINAYKRKRIKARIQSVNDWRTHRLDHIKVLYVDFSGKPCIVCLQLENSKLDSSNFMFDKKRIDEDLKKLSVEVPLDKQPKIVLGRSRRRRLEKKWLFIMEEINVRDLFFVEIDYSDGKVKSSRFDD